MNYGVRVWGPTGLLELDENSFTVRIVHSEIVQGSIRGPRTTFISVPGATTETHSAVCVPVAPYSTSAQDISAIQYTPIIDTDGVTVCFGNPAVSTGPVGIAPQRLLVMRHR